MKISLVIPAYNEARIIADTVRAAEEYLSGAFSDYELIIVDDGSTDSTLACAAAAGSDKVRVIGYEENRGKGYAVRTGMMAAEGELVFFTDADAAYGFEAIGKAVSLFESTHADAVLGSRRLTNGAYDAYPPLRRTASHCFALLTRLAAGINYDTQCGFKGFTKQASEKVFPHCTIDGFAFDFEAMMIFSELGMTAEQMPVRIINHRESTVHVLRDSLRMFADILKIRLSVRRRIRK